MKITKTPEMIQHFKKLREIANKNCNVCPCCGEKESTVNYNYKEDTLFIGDLQLATIRSDLYVCYTCGCEWESERYSTQ